MGTDYFKEQHIDPRTDFVNAVNTAEEKDCEEQNIIVTRNLKAMGLSTEMIAQATRLSLEDIDKL